jgi:hypothetical protein
MHHTIQWIRHYVYIYPQSRHESCYTVSTNIITVDWPFGWLLHNLNVLRYLHPDAIKKNLIVICGEVLVLSKFCFVFLVSIIHILFILATIYVYIGQFCRKTWAFLYLNHGWLISNAFFILEIINLRIYKFLKDTCSTAVSFCITILIHIYFFILSFLDFRLR